MFQRVILPEDYTSTKKYNDISLIELSRPLKFTETIKPICLQTENVETEDLRTFTIIGFGVVDRDTGNQ